ncbi:MAG: FtsW/RodA/SpoVE family cell cycle protein, partial [Zoogloea sp.]|nr:FtsW/RodA/SpoVE family cell cycle protein [Zoogloea sp.]
MIVLAILGFATVVMVSASPERLGTLGLNIVVAFTAMWIAARIPPQRMMSIALPLYIVGVLLLVGVALFGDVSKGARRWLNIGVARIQPSELMKIAMPLMLAWYFQCREG